MDHVSEKDGPKVVLSTSTDLRHDAGNILQPDHTTFWATTGSYPHEVIIKWPSLISAKSITVKLLGGMPSFIYA
jgi:hypothetical protein